MATDVKTNILSEIARAAYLVNGLNEDAEKMFEAKKQLVELSSDMQSLANASASYFHQLTQLLVDRGQDIPADDEQLNLLVKRLHEVEQQRRTLRKLIGEPFNRIGDVIEHWS